MLRKSVISGCLLFAGSSLSGPMIVGESTAIGQEYVLDELFGRGVHRYFAHDFAAAMENLTLAIDNGSQDPRAYYFRGLTAAAMGQFPQAESDFQTGAMLEAKGAYGELIGRSLARIQGPVRIHIEKQRQLARLELLNQRRAKDDIRFNQGVVPQVQPPAPSVVPPSEAPAVPPTPDTTNPFTEDPLSGLGDPTVDAPNALDGALDAAQPKPVTPTAGDDTTSPAPGLGTEPPAGNEPFPFGGDSGAGNTDDPFGGF